MTMITRYTPPIMSSSPKKRLLNVALWAFLVGIGCWFLCFLSTYYSETWAVILFALGLLCYLMAFFFWLASLTEKDE